MIKLIKFDIVIKNGSIIDGTGKDRFNADIGIIGDKIEKIGDIDILEAKKVIDAEDRIVCPGFIDTHSHSSLLIFKDPFLTPKIRQGITTELVAQDGMGPAPIDDANLSPWIKAMKGLEGKFDIEWTWRSVADYLEIADKLDLGPNIAYLAPHGNIRIISMGLDNRKPTENEMELMKKNLAKCIEEGAFGMSTGMIYPPCIYAETNELIELGKILNEKGAVYVTHQRNEGDNILDSMDETLAIGRESGCKIHFSHFKINGKKNWHKLEDVFDKLDRAKKDGISVSFDQYPYIAGSTMMSVILPPWVHDGGTDKLLERLGQADMRNQMKEDIKNGIEGWENYIDFAGLDGILVTFVKSQKNEHLVGKSLTEVGKAMGKDPIDAIFDLIFEEENIVGMINFHGTEEIVKKIMNRPEQNVGTDGIIGGKPHPRLYGTYPRFLGKYVRDEKMFSLETAINKMTGKAADVIGLVDRGILKEGLAADIVIFDAESIIDRGDYINPNQFPVGIDYVFVNGKSLVTKGAPTPQKAGKVLKSIMKK